MITEFLCLFHLDDCFLLPTCFPDTTFVCFMARKLMMDENVLLARESKGYREYPAYSDTQHAEYKMYIVTKYIKCR